MCNLGLMNIYLYSLSSFGSYDSKFSIYNVPFLFCGVGKLLWVI